MGKIEPSTELFIVAQGLFMYLEPEAVRHLLVEITKRFPGAEMAFDVIPRWLSRLTHPRRMNCLAWCTLLYGMLDGAV